mgnify:CR=1 FL=1
MYRYKLQYATGRGKIYLIGEEKLSYTVQRRASRSIEKEKTNEGITAVKEKSRTPRTGEFSVDRRTNINDAAIVRLFRNRRPRPA